MGVRQAVERYHHLHEDIKLFEPDYFPKAGEPSQSVCSRAVTPVPGGDKGGEAVDSARRPDA